MRPTPELLAAVARADAVFEPRLEAAENLCAVCVKEDRVPFEEALRPWRARRLELPLQAIWDLEMGHGSALVHGSPTRLRWFVPSFLSQSVREPEQFASVLARLAALLGEARRVGLGLGEEASLARVLSPGERDALAAFARGALDCAVRAADGFEEALAILTFARAADVDEASLAHTWLAVCDEEPTAVDALLRAVELAGRLGHPLPHAAEEVLRGTLAREPVRAWFERAFFASSDPEARRRLSAAEAVLRWLV